MSTRSQNNQEEQQPLKNKLDQTQGAEEAKQERQSVDDYSRIEEQNVNPAQTSAAAALPTTTNLPQQSILKINSTITRQRSVQSGQVSAGSGAKAVSTSQASRSQERTGQLVIQHRRTSKNTQRIITIKSDMISTGSVAPLTGSNLGSSIPTTNTRKVSTQAVGQSKKKTHRRSQMQQRVENGDSSNEAANIKIIRHKSAAVQQQGEVEGGAAKSVSRNKRDLAKQISQSNASAKNSAAVPEQENLSISNKRRSGSQQSQKVALSVRSKKKTANRCQQRQIQSSKFSANSKKSAYSQASAKSAQPAETEAIVVSIEAQGDETALGENLQEDINLELKTTVKMEEDDTVQDDVIPLDVNHDEMQLQNEQEETKSQRDITVEEVSQPGSAAMVKAQTTNLNANQGFQQTANLKQPSKEDLQYDKTEEQEQLPIESIFEQEIVQQDSDLQTPSQILTDRPIESTVDNIEKIIEILPPPNPLLPKTLKVLDKPPESNIKGIVFRKLKEFKQFPEQPNDKLTDYVGQIKNDRSKLEMTSPLKDKSSDLGTVQISIEQSRLIQNIVFLRDVAILDTLGKGIDELTQKDVFQHENFLDVKQLIRERDICERMTDQLENAISRAKRQQQTKMTSAMNNYQAPIGALDIRTGNYKLSGPEDKTLCFESRFESGNLYLATKVSEQEYDLLMQNDTNTLGHTQWFYFKVSNTRAGIPVKFNILNYNKPDSMFNYGMKVSVYSDRQADSGQVGWHRDCTDIRYFKNQVRKDFNFVRYYHTLTFTYEFKHENDNVFFAYCVPYTYTDLSNDIMRVERDKRRQSFMQRTTLCKTLGGVNCEVLTITEQQSEKIPASAFGSSTKNKNDNAQKQGVVISARVHPGETVGSWMMRGVILFLTDPDNKEAMVLRKNFIFKIVPMLNPDGVINGNYRCSLAGCDLNRRWKFPSKQIQPTVYHTKRLIKKVHIERTCVMYCDLHGHSRKPNVFMYGCDRKGAPEETRIFPLLLSKISPLFDFESSRFGVQKSKESTARVAVFKELKTCSLVYTMESTFSGLDKGPFSGLHITTDMLESMGRDLCRALLIQCNLEVPSELLSMPTVQTMKTKGKHSKTFSAEPPSDGESRVRNQHALSIKQTLIAELQANKELLRAGMGDSSSCGSESEPSEDNLDATELVKNLPAVDKPLSLALKQEQAARKEQARQRRSERTCSPLKGGEPRWRFTTTSNMKNYLGDNLDPASEVKAKKNRQTIKLSEIKEIKDEEISNQSPLKVVRDVTKQPVKNPKIKMVDAVTQTDRNDLSIKAQNQLKNIKNQSHREGTVQLRIANIELHETSFNSGSRSGFQNQTHHQHKSETTVNIQGPTVSDFNAIFSAGTVQIQATVNHNNGGNTAQGSYRKNNYQIQQELQNAASSSHFQRHRPPMMAKTAKMNVVNQPFVNYIHRNREKMPPTPVKDKPKSSHGSAINQAHEDDTGNSSGKEMTQSQMTDRSQSQIQARYGSVQQPRLKQLQEFQARSRAAQQHISQSRSQQNGDQGDPSSQMAHQEFLEGADGVNSLAKEADLVTQDVMNRIANSGGNQQRFIVNTNDYNSNNFQKTKRFQIGSGGSSGIHNNTQIGKKQSTDRRKSSQQLGNTLQQSDQAADPQLIVGTGQNVGEMILIEAQQKQNQLRNLRKSNDPWQQKQLYNQNQQMANQDGKRPGNIKAQSPLIAFLENQIQFERNQFEKTHVVKGNHIQKSVNEHPFNNENRVTFQGGSAQTSASLSRTGGFQSNPQQYQSSEEQQQRASNQLQERNSDARQNNQQLIQLRPIVTTTAGQKDNFPYLNQGGNQTSPVKLQQQNAQAHLNLTRIQTNQPVKVNSAAIVTEPQSESNFLNGNVEFQKGHTGVNTSKQMNYPRKLVGGNKAIPAGVRNQVQQQNISNLYNKVYTQQQQSKSTNPHSLNHHSRILSDSKASADTTLITADNQSSMFAINKAQSVKGSGYNSLKQSVQYTSDNANNTNLQKVPAKFMLANQQQKPHGNKFTINHHTSNQSPSSPPERISIQQMRERQNISDMQIYRNKTMQSALGGGNISGQESQLPTLQKFGSQNEILNSTLQTGSRSNLRQTALNSHKKSNKQLGSGASFTRNQPDPNNHLMRGQNNGSFEYTVPIVGKDGKGEQPNNTSAFYNQTAQSANNNQKVQNGKNQMAQLSKAHAEGRPLNGEMRMIQHSSPQQRQAQQQSNSTGNKQKGIVYSYTDSNGQGQHTTATQQKLDSDYFMIMRQHNQAFAPTGKTISKKKVSSSSQGPNAIVSTLGGGGGVALSAAQAQRSQNNTILNNNGKNNQGSIMYPSIPPSQSHNASPPVVQSLNLTQNEARSVTQTNNGSYMAGATGPIEFGVLQTRQLVNSNNLAALSPFKTNTKGMKKITNIEQKQQAVFAQRKSSQINYRSETTTGTGALPIVLANATVAAASTIEAGGNRTELKRKTSNHIQGTFISSKK